MSTTPKHVFTTCTKAESNVSSYEYKIFNSSGRLLMIVKDRRISYNDVVKAAKCANLSSFNVRKVGFTTIIEKREFPVASSVVVMAPAVFVPEPRMISQKTNKIIMASDGRLLQLVKGPITKAHLDKAAKCAGIKEYTAWKYKVGTPKLVVTDTSTFDRDVFLRRGNAASIFSNPIKKKLPKKLVTVTLKMRQKKLVNDAIIALKELAKTI